VRTFRGLWRCLPSQRGRQDILQPYPLPSLLAELPKLSEEERVFVLYGVARLLFHSDNLGMTSVGSQRRVELTRSFSAISETLPIPRREAWIPPLVAEMVEHGAAEDAIDAHQHLTGEWARSIGICQSNDVSCPLLYEATL
jgi:hypothetical protein